jgi:hypothetical protein
MNLNKILAAITLTTFMTMVSKAQSQSEKYSFSVGGSYMIPKKELKQTFNFLKGLEMSFAIPINTKSSVGLTYYSGYRWGTEPAKSIELESKINADGFSINYNHEIMASKIIKPFYELGIGYEKFRLGRSEGQKRITENIGGGTLNLGAGTSINLNKKKNKELYFGIKKEFFIPNSKTNQKYSNIKITTGMNFKKYSRSKLK